MAFYTLLFLLLIPLLLIWNKINQQKTQNQQFPPSPPKLPLLGNLHQIGPLPHQSFAQLSRKYGPVMLFHFGCLPIVVISSAEAAEQILKTHDLDCCNRPSFTGVGKLTYDFRDLSFSPYGDYWRQIRKICVLHLFSVKRVQSFRFIREEEVDSVMNSISQSSDSGSAVDLSQKIYALTGSIILRTAFGQRFKGSMFDKDKFSELVRAGAGFFGSLSAQEMFPYIGWIVDKVSGYHVKLEKVFQEVDTFFEEVIKDHVEKPERETEGQEDIVDVMLRIERNQRQNGEEGWFTRVHIKAILMDIFFAGIDTSANTIIWAMAELARNPRVMKKVQDEVRNYVGSKGKITEDDIDQLHYMNLVLKETLRLHPVVPLLLPRETISQVKINDFDLLPKTIVQVNVWSIGRDPNYWEKPGEFLPERFMVNTFDVKGQNFEFLPFGSGRRSCPGILLGLRNVELALATLLYNFDWHLPAGMNNKDIDMEETIGMSLTVSKKVPLKLISAKYLEASNQQDK